MTTNNSTITIHTDGVCKRNPGPGSWAAIIEDDKKRFLIANRVGQTTSQRMELTAAVKALSVLNRHVGRPIRLVTDCQVLVKGMTEWLVGWKASGWRKSDGKPVLNVELWRQLDVFNEKHTITWEWVRGHNGHHGNEEADALANRALIEGRISEEVYL
ncbi:Ribonuclease HI [Marinobacter litoralis]|uniref:Ribonuclease H n=1 Tax=Marinobacter litoralis TaxID=187981 RepID=A0A3M2RJA9_9GAMM|nr:ribonuclease HI [Marinobacter litoralis]RMJ05420.1 Ribonuclease HI [Marinobacter litoralis]